MNHLTATYIDFIQTIGVLAVIAFTSYAVKQILLRVEGRIEEVKVKIEE